MEHKKYTTPTQQDAKGLPCFVNGQLGYQSESYFDQLKVQAKIVQKVFLGISDAIILISARSFAGRLSASLKLNQI